ncbi:DUF3307 domain-containing protein [Synechococcus sp. RSCCF101]|nr:DUF3307 domain-containing protein [Synechococcus sp. RSCCF101]
MLVMGHWLGDFGLQSDRMAQEKCPGCGHTLSWGWWMAAHGGIHGFLVAWISGVAWLGILEWGVHMLIDIGKCRRLYRMVGDQSLHMSCKLLWVLLAGVTGSITPG